MQTRTHLSRWIVIAMWLLTLFLVPAAASSSTSQGEEEPTPQPPVATPTPSPSTESEIVLRYIAEQYHIPQEQLVIANEHRREYPNIGRRFVAFTLLDSVGQRFFNLMVDLKDRTVVEDVAAVAQAEADAERAKYGKLEPALYERLQKAADNELVEVAFWIAGRPRRSQEELYVELAARFPEAGAAMNRSGKPFDIEDTAVRTKIEQAYAAMLEADVQPLVQPVVAALAAQGYTVTSYGGLPSVTAVLPKRVILALVQRPDIGRAFLIEGELQPQLDSAVPGDRISNVWREGFNGAGRSIAILEDGNVDFSPSVEVCGAGTSNCFRFRGESRSGYSGEQDHTTLVASVAASDHATQKGMAPGATIHSVGVSVNSYAALVEALKQSLAPSPTGVNADVVNVSYGGATGQGMHWADQAYDYWTRYYQRTVVVAAGNTTSGCVYYYLCTPAKAWNVISAGAYDDSNNSNWSDDLM